MRAVICVNGVIHNYPRIRPWLEQADLRIAADGGLRHFQALAIQPHALVGDLDSVDPQIPAALAAQGVVVEHHRPDKDETDIELALEYALRQGATEIVLLGALGGRLDQTLANLLILAQRDWPAVLSVVEESQIATLLRPASPLDLSGSIGDVVSLIPLTAQVTGVTYTGLRYPLDNATLTFGSTRGISNELAAPRATVRLATGLALVVHTQQDK